MRIAAGVVALLCTGATIRPFTTGLPRGIGTTRGLPAAEFFSPGSTCALFGGLRTVAADLAWLRAFVSWERRDSAATEAMLRLTTALDPVPVYFWINGARMIAYDMPAWLPADATSGAIREREAAHARRALDFLANALINHPANAALWIERGNIELHRLHDLGAAAESYRRASELPGAPFYAARIYAELLRRAGRQADALSFLVALYPKLPASDETAGAELVLYRIRILEQELAIPADACFDARRSKRDGESL